MGKLVQIEGVIKVAQGVSVKKLYYDSDSGNPHYMIKDENNYTFPEEAFNVKAVVKINIKFTGLNGSAWNIDLKITNSESGKSIPYKRNGIKQMGNKRFYTFTDKIDLRDI